MLAIENTPEIKTPWLNVAYKGVIYSALHREDLLKTLLELRKNPRFSFYRDSQDQLDLLITQLSLTSPAAEVIGSYFGGNLVSYKKLGKTQGVDFFRDEDVFKKDDEPHFRLFMVVRTDEISREQTFAIINNGNHSVVQEYTPGTEADRGYALFHNTPIGNMRALNRILTEYYQIKKTDMIGIWSPKPTSLYSRVIK